jgi:hypothetical protein
VTTRIFVLPSGILNLRTNATSPPNVPVIATRPLLDIFDKAFYQTFVFFCWNPSFRSQSRPALSTR